MPITPGAMVAAAGINSAANALTSGGTSTGGSSNASISASRTYGTEASSRATQAAASANSAANEAWEKAAAYNSYEAAKQREWQERMANTVYQRTVADMKAAGINPVLAAGMGLGTASVNSGATASMGNPMSYMASTFADSESASQSKGSSWQDSMSGIAYLADALKDMVANWNSAFNFNINLGNAQQLLKDAAEKSNPTGTEMDKDNYRNSGKSKGSIWDSITKSLYGLTKTTGGAMWNGMSH